MSENLNLLAYSAKPGEVYWREPAQYTPPVGRKLLLLTEGGVAVIGLWHRDGGFVAWSPLPKRKDKKVMKQKTKWTADEISGMLAYVFFLMLMVAFFSVAFSKRAALEEKEAKASGQSECAAKHIPAEAPLR